MSKIVNLKDVTASANESIKLSEPWIAEVEITGSAALLFHRWNNEAVAEKSAARKGSAAKKTDNLESYVWRNKAGELCIPGEYLRGAIVGAAKFRQDPRSPRKSAQDLFKAAVISLTELAPLGVNRWDYLDSRRVVIQRNAVTRIRPAMLAGWKIQVDLLVNLPEYVDQPFLLEILSMAGKLIGIADFRPTYGRFDVTSFRVKAP